MTRIPLSERFSVWMEVEILSRLTPKDGVGPVFKWIFKIPVLYYKLGLGWMLGKRFLLLTTTGRRSGKPRQTPLEFVYNPQEDSYRVSPGWASMRQASHSAPSPSYFIRSMSPLLSGSVGGITSSFQEVKNGHVR